LDWLQDRSGGLERASESRIRGPLTHIGVYEPTVIYFGLTNSPATFQTIMNDLFQDLINQEDTTTFIDNILVATDTKEEHDELVEEVLRGWKKTTYL